MKINKIENAYVNEFDGEAQRPCWADCQHFYGGTEGQRNWLRRLGLKADASLDDIKKWAENSNVYGSYCWESWNAETTVWF